jgi:hypothetical protein
MENEKLQVVMGPTGKADIIIREVKEVNELPLKAPVKIQLSGVIGAPVEFLSKRLSEIEQINQKRCHVIVTRESLSIVLIINENDEYTLGSVTGKLEHHPKFKEFGINSGKGWDANELGQFCKMNRAFFIGKAENMDLVTKLKNFEAKVNTVIEKQKAESGDFKDNYSGVVTSNLPGAFKLKIPLFKGRTAEEIEVEFYASVNGRTVALQLFSPGASQAIEELRDQAIDLEVEKIRAIAPDIAIIEK